jgi:hypothetical protein
MRAPPAPARRVRARGDSITESQAYLQGLGCGEERLAGHADLRPAIRFFHRTRFPDPYTVVWCGYADSFSRASGAAMSGQTAGWVISRGAAVGARCRAGESPMGCEYRLLRDINRIVTQSRNRDVIPVLSTIPPRLDSARLNRRVNAYNDALFRRDEDHDERRDPPVHADGARVVGPRPPRSRT